MGYRDLMGGKKVLVTFFLGLIVLGSLAFYQISRLPEPMDLDTQGLPTIGNGQLHLVAFEDLRCCNCKIFHETVFSQIQTHYIDSGKARYTLVPLAFMGGSKPLANAALAVYRSTPDRFFPFVGELFGRFQLEDPDREGLLEAAKSIGGIDLAFLDDAIQRKSFYEELDRILNWAKEIMREDFGVPTLYVNGIHSSTRNFQAVKARIQRIQK